MTTYLHTPQTKEIKETSYEVCLKDLKAFLGAALMQHPENDWTYQVSNFTYKTIIQNISRFLLTDELLRNCIEVEYSDNNEEEYFEVVYSRQISHSGAFETAILRFENLDTMYAEDVMRATIENARPISERIHFPVK
jgi:hypothetical protein